MKVKTISAAGVTTISDNVCPENIVLSVWHGVVSRVRVNVAGVGYIADLDERAIKAIGQAQNKKDASKVTAENVEVYMIPLADGYHPNTRTEIEITTTGAAVDAKVYYLNTQEGSLFVKTERQVVFANQPAKVTDFAMVFLNSPNDWTGGLEDEEINIEFSNGVRHSSTVGEMVALAMKETGFTDVNGSPFLDNTDQVFKSVEFVSSTDCSLYKVSYIIDKPELLEKKAQKLVEISERKGIFNDLNAERRS